MKSNKKVYAMTGWYCILCDPNHDYGPVRGLCQAHLDVVKKGSKELKAKQNENKKD